VMAGGGQWNPAVAGTVAGGNVLLNYTTEVAEHHVAFFQHSQLHNKRVVETRRHAWCCRGWEGGVRSMILAGLVGNGGASKD